MVGSTVYRGLNVHETASKDIVIKLDHLEALQVVAAGREITLGKAIGEAIRDAIAPGTMAPEIRLTEHPSKFTGYAWYTLEMPKSYGDTIEVKRSRRDDKRDGEKVILDAIDAYTAKHGYGVVEAADFVHSKEPLLPMWRGH